MKRLWRGLCEKKTSDWRDRRYSGQTAGCPGLLFRGLRRSAVRNMMPAGVQPAVAMKIGGHSTPHIFQRYNISGEAGLHEAVKKVEEHKG